MLSDVRYLLSSFSGADRLRLWLYVSAQFALSLMDLVGLAAVLPLMQVLLEDNLSEGYIGVLHRLFGMPSREQFVLLLAGAMVAAFTVKLLAGLLLQWWSVGFILRLQIKTATRLLRSYSSEDYLTHKRRDVAEVMRTVDASVGDAHGRVLGGLLSLVSAGLSIGMMIALLLAVAPQVTLAALVYFGLGVFALQRALAKRNQQAGKDAVMSSWFRSLALLNAMFAFREIKMHDAQDEFVERFRDASVKNGEAARRALFFGSVPKYVLELMTITGIAIILVVTTYAFDAQRLMPTLTLFVAATVKLQPTMSALTTTLGNIRSGRTGLRFTVQALESAQKDAEDRSPVTDENLPREARGSGTIEVSDLTFRYPDGVRDVLNGIDLAVPPGTSLALCGASGSGKTTLVDIILGLIRPTHGSVRYGGIKTADLGRGWHDVVAYVPQDVFILNDTLSANVAFGVSEGERDASRIEAALRNAELGDLLAELPEGLDTWMGDRGSRLSGGQRQRIGIARAIYRDPRIVVFDEATSALDNETEHEISRTIRGMTGQVTTIIVAHRLSTVRHVDQLAYLENGHVTAVGSFEEVRRGSKSFARMVELGRLDGEPSNPATEEPSD